MNPLIEPTQQWILIKTFLIGVIDQQQSKQRAGSSCVMKVKGTLSQPAVSCMFGSSSALMQSRPKAEAK